MPTVLKSLNTALHKALAVDERVLVLGEDILDPYGGAFKVTQGLSDAFPNRVLTTPISEAGIVGLATGMAMRGLRPVVEIMFGDFITLISDQVINHATKFHWMYSGGKSTDDQVRVPIVIRTPMGGRRGYGPTHSQTLEKFFMGVSGLRLLAPCALGDPGKLLLQAILEDNDPVLFIENKLLYLLPQRDINDLDEFVHEEIFPNRTETSETGMGKSYAPTYLLTIRGAPPPQLTITAYGYMVELALQAAQQLAYEREIFVELVVPTQLAPFEIKPILASTERTGRLLVAEEGTFTLGWGAEILAQTAEALGSKSLVANRLAARDLPIPASSPLESAFLPGTDDFIRTIQKMV